MAAILVLGMAMMSPVWAQVPPPASVSLDAAMTELNEHWIAFSILTVHLGKAIAGYQAAANAAKAKADDLESRLDWVLKNWVPHPAGGG